MKSLPSPAHVVVAVPEGFGDGLYIRLDFVVVHGPQSEPSIGGLSVSPVNLCVARGTLISIIRVAESPSSVEDAA